MFSKKTFSYIELLKIYFIFEKYLRLFYLIKIDLNITYKTNTQIIMRTKTGI